MDFSIFEEIVMSAIYVCTYRITQSNAHFSLRYRSNSPFLHVPTSVISGDSLNRVAGIQGSPSWRWATVTVVVWTLLPSSHLRLCSSNQPVRALRVPLAPSKSLFGVQSSVFRVSEGEDEGVKRVMFLSGGVDGESFSVSFHLLAEFASTANSGCTTEVLNSSLTVHWPPFSVWRHCLHSSLVAFYQARRRCLHSSFTDFYQAGRHCPHSSPWPSINQETLPTFLTHGLLASQETLPAFLTQGLLSSRETLPACISPTWMLSCNIDGDP